MSTAYEFDLTMGPTIKTIRTLYDVKSKDLATAINISPSYLSEIETGKKEPSLTILNKIGSHFNLKLSTITLIAETIHNLNKNNTPKMIIQKTIMAIITNETN